MSENPGYVQKVASTGINMDAYRTGGGFGGGAKSPYCGSPHPDNPDPDEAELDDEFVFCRRLKNHGERDDDGHAAFSFLISTPEYWADEHPDSPPF